MKILFFDGQCVMCNGLVDFIFRHDPKGSLKVATLQGETAKKMLADEHLKQLSHAVFTDGERIYTESDAVIQALLSLEGVFKLSIILKIFPKLLRDRIYRLIAKNRYRLFGKNEFCRMPSPAERDRMLP